MSAHAPQPRALYLAPNTNEMRRSPPRTDHYIDQVDCHFEKFNEEISRVLRNYKDDISPLDISRDSPDSVDDCLVAIQTSPMRSQNSSPSLLSDYDSISNCSLFTCKTSSSSSSSQQCSDNKSTSPLFFDAVTRTESSNFNLNYCVQKENENLSIEQPNQIKSDDNSQKEKLHRVKFFDEIPKEYERLQQNDSSTKEYQMYGINSSKKHLHVQFDVCPEKDPYLDNISFQDGNTDMDHKLEIFYDTKSNTNHNEDKNRLKNIPPKENNKKPSKKTNTKKTKKHIHKMNLENHLTITNLFYTDFDTNTPEISLINDNYYNGCYENTKNNHNIHLNKNDKSQNPNGNCDDVDKTPKVWNRTLEFQDGDQKAAVWVLRSDVNRNRSAEDRRGVVFDSFKSFDEISELDQPLNSTSSSSLPLTHNLKRSNSNIPYHSTSNMFITDLGNKSSSAPVLKKVNESQELLSSHAKGTCQPRSQSDRHLAEIQAAEACKWLRAAGFPQYAQMYEDHQFPIDLSAVQKDHSFLEADSCKSLFRRLDTLNKCANIKIDSWRSTQDDSEDENQCALSENWTFQHDQKRWSRIRQKDPLQPLCNTDNLDRPNTNSLPRKNTSSRYDIDLLLDSEDMSLNRSGSERIKDGAKALLRRVESFKSRRRKRQNREGVVINKDGDVITLQHKHNLSIPTLVLPKNIDSDYNQYSPKSPHSPNYSATLSPRKLLRSPLLFPSKEDTSRRAFVNRRGSVSLDRRDTVEAMSDSELQSRRSSKKVRNANKRQDPQLPVSDYDSDLEEHDVGCQFNFRTSWHSFQRGISQTQPKPEGVPISSLTCGQFQVLRKLALLKLTGLIESYCPTHKTGWNWELPKFIRKIKTPDYKSKSVFGVPLSVIQQRSGYPLPLAIHKAMEWLRSQAKDQIGLFRKSGVRSRIHALKADVEKTCDFTLFDEQQAYDVADMVKQYFRELPEALLTTKLSETLILIFLHVPEDYRNEAISYVILLMPNEHCEVLQNVLHFFDGISQFACENQMTASNLALCFAPSLFYYNQAATLSATNLRTTSTSPRRRGKGAPDISELNENKAAHDCLLYMIKNRKTLFTVPKDMLVQCKFTDLDESKPVPLTELGDSSGWRGYLDDCIHALHKEARDRTRGWISPSGTSSNDIEVAYKKVGDGHPLRLWRISTEVEAPPEEVLHRILRERSIWDDSFREIQCISLDAQSEIYQYDCQYLPPLFARDYCVLRTWKTNLPRGGCVIVETSVDHKDAEVKDNAVRAVVLASRYLIEPCGAGKSRLMHLSRIDLMGRTPEWYNKSYGHVCKLYLREIRNSFKHSTYVGPESKV